MNGDEWHPRGVPRIAVTRSLAGQVAVVERQSSDGSGYRAPWAEALFAFAASASVAIKDFANWSRQS